MHSSRCWRSGSGRQAEYEIERQPYVTAYHEPIAAALWHVNSGQRPPQHVEVRTVSDLLVPDGGGVIQHVSLGEDLTTSMSYDPHMPALEVLRHAAALDEGDQQRLVVVEMVRTHLEFCSRLGIQAHIPAGLDAGMARLVSLASAPRKDAAGDEVLSDAPSDVWEDVS